MVLIPRSAHTRVVSPPLLRLVAKVKNRVCHLGSYVGFRVSVTFAMHFAFNAAVSLLYPLS